LLPVTPLSSLSLGTALPLRLYGLRPALLPNPTFLLDSVKTIPRMDYFDHFGSGDVLLSLPFQRGHLIMDFRLVRLYFKGFFPCQ